jgi:cobalt-zinc-cadmium resistance protein CzcA
MIAVPVSLLLIFLLLFFAFNSVKHGLLIYSAIPLSAIGGIFFLALRGMPFSISAGVGFIALFGVAVLNGIVLISEFNQLKAEGMNDLHRIVLMGTKVRLRPVLMTAFVASLGFLPMALSNGAGAEVQRPLATVVIGGLLIATFLTLFVLPILYVTFEKGMNIKSLNKSATLIAILISLSSTSLQAQNPISLETALETALKNNNSVKNDRLKADYQKQLIKTAANLPATTLTGEYGQINSFYNDIRLGLAQSFNFPTVYSRQKQLYTEEWKAAALNVSLKEAELKKEVTQLFYAILYASKKELLLQKSDSLFTLFAQKATLRFKKGESNILEKTTAETQQGSIQSQLLQLQQEKDVLKSKFQLLLNSDTDVMPTTNALKLSLTTPLDSAGVANHPTVKLLEQQKKVTIASTQAERSKLLPSFTLGYSSATITGTGADNVVYDKATRFQSAQLGLGIPLFGGAQKAKIKAAKLAESIADSEWQYSKKAVQQQFINAQSLYKKSQERLDYYEKIALSNASIISATANKQFYNGEINYLDWVMLIHQSIAIQNDYINTLNQYNDAVIQLNYLTSKN